VTLVANDDYHPQIKIKVSSCVLAHSSSVFKVLFSSRFAEGQTLRSVVQEISLVDHPGSLLLLCQMLHPQDYDCETLLLRSALLDFAQMVDK